MADGDDERPIIIKKIKKGGHGHHGGAWKVAYADFVTAMMAFFLLLWLIASTSEETKEGIADYFTPTIGLKDEIGIGFEGGVKPESDGTEKDDTTPVGIVFGAPPTGEIVKSPDQLSDDYKVETQVFEKVENQVEKLFEEELGAFKKNLLIDQTPEGLRIQVVDQDKLSMFKPGSAELQPFAKMILRKLAPIIQSLPNRMSVSGHTDSVGYGANAKYSNWELSADRANATRRYLVQSEVDQKKFAVVQGKADRDPLLPHDPTAERNRRISLVLLRKHLYPYEVPAPDDLLRQPKADDLIPNFEIPH